MRIFSNIRQRALKKRYEKLNDHQIIEPAISDGFTEVANQIIMNEIRKRNLLQEFHKEKNKEGKFQHNLKKFSFKIFECFANLIICALFIGHGVDAIYTKTTYYYFFRQGSILLKGIDAQIWGICALFSGLFAAVGGLNFAYKKFFPKMYIKYNRKLMFIFYIVFAIFIYFHFTKSL